MRLLHIITVVISALILFGCADDSAKEAQNTEPQNTPDSCDESCSGAPTCLDDATLKTCQLNQETGCMEWVESTCQEGESCLNGACEPKTDPPECLKECTQCLEYTDTSAAARGHVRQRRDSLHAKPECPYRHVSNDFDDPSAPHTKRVQGFQRQ